jgi:hypothetical protein
LQCAIAINLIAARAHINWAKGLFCLKTALFKLFFMAFFAVIVHTHASGFSMSRLFQIEAVDLAVYYLPRFRQK